MASYTVVSGDTLTGIALKLGLCRKGPGNTLTDWSACLAVAKQLAGNNGIPWGGPPNYSAPIRPGQVLQLPGSGDVAVVPLVEEPSAWSSWWLLSLVGGLGLLALTSGSPRRRRG